MVVCDVIMRVLDDAFPDFEGEIQAAKRGVALLEILNDAECVQVVVKGKSVLAHRGVERFFSSVAEGRVAEVMDKSEGFGEIHVEAEGSGDGAGDLRNLKSVSQAVA